MTRPMTWPKTWSTGPRCCHRMHWCWNWASCRAITQIAKYRMTFRGFTLFRFELSTWASHAGAYHSKSQCVFWGVSFHCRITFRSHWCALVYIGIDRLIAFVKIIFAFELHSITETLAQRCCFYACKDLYESVTFFFRRNPHFILQENEIVHSVNVLTHTFMSWGVPVCRTCAHSAWGTATR